MTLKEKFNSIDQSRITADQKSFLDKMKNVTKDFTLENKEVNEKVEGALDKMITSFKEKMPDAIKTTKKVVAPKNAKEKKTVVKTSGGKRTIMSVAKDIRKEGESWKDAQKRASDMLKKDKSDVSKVVETELQKLSKFIKGRKELEGLSGTDLKRDSHRTALPKGRRLSKEGNVYYENRDNRTDRLAPNYPKDAPLLELGGGVDFYEQLSVYVQGVGSIYSGTSMKKAIDKAREYEKKNKNAEIVIVDEKYGDEYDTDGNFINEYEVGGGIRKKNGQTYDFGSVWTNDHNQFDKDAEHEVNYRKRKRFELGGTVVTDLAGQTSGGDLGLNAGMPLSGFSNTAYTGLVGETGAMSSGEMFEKGGALYSAYTDNPLKYLSLMGAKTYGNLNYSTSKNGIDYFIGRKKDKYGDNKAIVVAFITDENNYMIDKEDAKEMSETAREKGVNLVELYTNYGVELRSTQKPQTLGFDKIVKVSGNYENGVGVHNSILLYEGQSLLLQSVPSPKEYRFLNKEIVVEKIYGNKIVESFVRETGEKVPFVIDPYKYKIEQYELGGGLPSGSEQHYVNYYLGSGTAQHFVKGGAIKNQYAGRTSEDIWDNWTERQKRHFLVDHKNHVYKYGNLYDSLEQKEELITKNYSELPKNLRLAISDHIETGEYKGGGMLKPNERYILEIKGLTGLRKEAIESYISENNLSDNDVLNIVIGLGRKQLKGTDVASAVVGKKGNSLSKEIIQFAKDNKGMKLEEGGNIDAFTLRMVKGNAGNPDEVMTESRSVQFVKGGAVSQKEKREKYLDNLSMLESEVWDKIGANSGGEIRQNETLLRKYAEGVGSVMEKEGVGYGSFDEEDYEYFQDENAHLFNEFLVWNNYYEPTMTKKEKAWRLKMYNEDVKEKGKSTYISNPNIITLNSTKRKSEQPNKSEKKYILHADIKSVKVYKGSKVVTYSGKDVLNGANILKNGGGIQQKAYYIPKREVVEVELKNGETVKPANGYWIKKDAKQSFETGGDLGIEEEIDLTDDNRLRVKELTYEYKKPTSKELAEKYNSGAYEFMGKDKMMSGGKTKKGNGEAMQLAKKIRKDGEKWTDAVKRAWSQLK